MRNDSPFVFGMILLIAGSLGLVVKASGIAGDLLDEARQTLLVAGLFSVFVVARKGARLVHDRLFAKRDRKMRGLRCVAPIRENYDGYGLWAKNHDPQQLAFAGRSVLHRIDADFRRSGLGSAEEVIARRLAEGASFQIMFLDPRSNLIERLSQEEGQTPQEMIRDLAYSIGVVKRLHQVLSEKSPPKSNVTIRVYDENPWFAYHRCDDQVILGFFFCSPLRHRSAAYEAADPHTRELFDSHIAALWLRAADTTLLDVNGRRNRIRIDSKLLGELEKILTEYLGKEEASALLLGERKRPPNRG